MSLLTSMASRVPRDDSSPRVLNINVGILGHVDSGKTSLGEDRMDNAVVQGGQPTAHYQQSVLRLS